MNDDSVNQKQARCDEYKFVGVSMRFPLSFLRFVEFANFINLQASVPHLLLNVMDTRMCRFFGSLSSPIAWTRVLLAWAGHGGFFASASALRLREALAF